MLLTAMLLLAAKYASAYGPILGLDCVGVKLTAGTSIQSAVDENPQGTIFCLGPGTYLHQTVIPKDNDQFIGLYGAVLDGGNVVKRAFDGTATGVVIQNLKITHYNPPAQDSAVHGVNGYRWIVKNNEIIYNGGAGVDVGDHMQVVGNKINNNLQIGVDMNGFGDRPGFDILVDSNEIGHNNYAETYDTNWEAGGAKFWNSVNLTVSNNYVHDNIGPGLWTDTNNIGTTYSGNRIENNFGSGVLHEVSYDAVIRNNIIRNNGSTSRHNCPGWLWCSGITISSSGAAATTNGKIDIYGNIVVPGKRGNGIALVQNDRSKDRAIYGPHVVRHVHVHDNLIDLSTETYEISAEYDNLNGNGAVGDDNQTDIFTTRDNRFERNTYYLRGDGKQFSWLHRQGDLEFWNSMGQDRDGRFFFGSSVYAGGAQVTAALSAQPFVLPTGGGIVKLTWQSSNAASCTGSNFPGKGASGAVTVNQSRTITYMLTCSGPTTSASTGATVRVR